MIKLGTNSIGKIYLGSNAIGKAYLGSNLVFQSGVSPTPPQPQPILPAGFTELAYVGTNGAAFIDTGVAGASDLEITTKFFVGSYSQYASIYGNYIDETYNYNRAILGTSNTVLIIGGGLNRGQSVSAFSLNSVHTLKVNSTTAILDGNSTALSSQSYTANTKNITLGASGSGGATSNIGLRIYSFEIKKDGTTVLNLVPAMRDSDDAVGFYDLVSDSFVKSLTGTEFTAGPANNYAPVEYIKTDGNCYIIPGNAFAATPPKSSEIKVKMGSNTACSLLAGFLVSSGGDSKQFALARLYGGCACLSYYSNYGSGDGMPSVSYSISNDLPFIVKTDIEKGAQHISVKQENSESWTTATKSNNNTVSSTYLFCILGAYRNGGYEDLAPNGTRLYYCKIYSDATYGGLVFDGVPCYYNGQYGLWDKVSGTFKANSGSGTISGPSNS